MASVGADNEHTLVVYDWQSRECVYSTPTNIDKVYCVRFLPEPSGMMVSAGIKHVYFWEPSHKDLVVTKSSLPIKGSEDHITIVDIVFVNRKKIIGAAAEGHLCVWDRKKIETMVSFESGSVKNAHPGGIACIHTNKSEDVIITGGVKDPLNYGIPSCLTLERTPHMCRLVLIQVFVLWIFWFRKRNESYWLLHEETKFLR